MTILGFSINSTLIVIGIILLALGLIRKIIKLVIIGIIVAVIATLFHVVGPELVSAAVLIR